MTGQGAAKGTERPPLPDSTSSETGHSPHERKSTALSRKSVAGDVNISHLPAPLEHAPQVFRRGAVREVVYFQGDHAVDAGWRPTVTHFAVEPLSLATTEVT